jgi:drug/metabolite transporter (DMT)-like permease
MIGEFCALLGACSFSTHNIAVRRGMRTAPDSGVFMSTSISTTIFLVVIVVLYSGRLLPPLTVMGFFLFVIAGLFTSFTGRSLHYAAIRALGPSRATSFRASSPLITICLAFTFLSERFTPVQFIGAALVIGGVSFLSSEVIGRTDLAVRSKFVPVTSDPRNSPGRPLTGIFCALASALSFGTGHFLRKLALKEVPSPYWGLAVGTTAAWLALVAHTALRGRFKEACKNNFNYHAPPWFYITAGVLATSGQLFVYLAIYFTEVSVAMVLASSEPLATLLISRLLLGKEEPMNRRVVFCSGTVFLGIIFMIL